MSVPKPVLGLSLKNYKCSVFLTTILETCHKDLNKSLPHSTIVLINGMPGLLAYVSTLMTVWGQKCCWSDTVERVWDSRNFPSHVSWFETSATIAGWIFLNALCSSSWLEMEMYSQGTAWLAGHFAPKESPNHFMGLKLAWRVGYCSST